MPAAAAVHRRRQAPGQGSAAMGQLLRRQSRGDRGRRRHHIAAPATAPGAGGDTRDLCGIDCAHRRAGASVDADGSRIAQRLMTALLDHIRTRVRQHPDRIAVDDGCVRLSYVQLLAQVDGIADQLHADGCRTLALLANNSSAWIALDLACLAAGVQCIPLPGFFTDAQLRHALVTSGADRVVDDNPQRLRALLPKAQPCASIAGLAAFANPDATPTQSPTGTCKITFTSGSTGAPKGVCLSAAALYAVAASLLQLTSDIDVERHFSALPYATLLENIAGIYLPLLRGATVIALPPQHIGFNGARLEQPQQLLQALSRTQPHSLIVLPQFLHLFLAAHRDGWRAPDSL